MTALHPGAPQRDDLRHGAYGLRLSGLESARQHLVAAPPDWPELRVERVVDVPDLRGSTVQDDWAEYRVLGGGSARLDRDPLTVRFTAAQRFSDDATVHPGLAMLAAITNHWLGRDAFHAGGFIADGGAWGVLGPKGAGKSTILGHLAASGVGIVADDLLVIDDGSACAGPRCVDLREQAALRQGHGHDIGVVGDRRRWRVRLPVVPSTVPLRGWIVPVWGDHVELEPVPLLDRLPILYANLGLIRVPPRPERLLRLAALPFLAFRRPRRWEEMERAISTLRDEVSR